MEIPHVIIPVMFQKVRSWMFLALALMISACTATTEEGYTPTSLPQKELTPYTTSTSTETPIVVVETTPIPLPSPTPTPRVHIVKAGEDLGGIAYLYKVSLQNLMALNPEVDSRLLSVGTQLIIPPAVEESSEENLLPVPSGVALSDIVCRGMWCFVNAASGDQPVENVTAEIRIKLTGEEDVRSGLAVSPVDRLPANSTIPLMARFSSPVSSPFQVSAELISALPIGDENERYLDIRVRDIEFEVSPDGLYAEVKGVVVNRDERNAGLIRVVLVARDEEGRIVGVRIWENDAGLESEQRITFQERVYSVGGNIKDAGVLAEARP